MNRTSLILSVFVLAFFMVSGLALAQNHHPDAAAKGEAVSEAGAMPMAMSQKMMGGQAGMKGGMMQGDMMAKCKQMHSGMMGKGMKHGGSMMAAMNDPVIKTLHGYGCPGFLLKSAGKLELTKSQIASLKALKTEFQKTVVRNKADIEVAKIELKELLDADNPNFNKVKSKVNQIGTLEQQLRLNFLDKVVQSRKILTADQLQKLKALSDNCCKGKGMMGKGMK